MKNNISQVIFKSSMLVIASAAIFVSGYGQTPAAPVTPPGSTAPPTSVPSVTPQSLPGQPAPLPGSTTPPGQTNNVNTIPNGSAPVTTPNPNSAYPNGGADSSKLSVPNQNYRQPVTPRQTSPVTPLDTSGYQPHS